MNVLFAASEAVPFASTGGLAGVAASLPAALVDAGHRVTLIMPLYSDIRGIGDPEWVQHGVTTSAGEHFGLAKVVHPHGGFDVLLVSKDEYFNRPGLYGRDPATAYRDNAARFAFFCRAVVAVCDNSPVPVDVLHCNDWQCGLIPLYLRNAIRPATVFTIHNLHFQGNFPPEEYSSTHLPGSLYSMEGLEFYGTFSFMKAGIVFSDRITTVSETYAREVQTPQFGEGMDGILRERSDRFRGILNGIDNDLWDPSTDCTIAEVYSAGSITGKRKCRTDLRRRMGFKGDGFTAGLVSRLSGQKGIDLLISAMENCVRDRYDQHRSDEGRIDFALLGTGEKRLEKKLLDLSVEFAGSISVDLRYDPDMARRIFAGSDVILMPSRFEPCGLAQMIGMRYGSVPVVRNTGGLADTVKDVDEGGYGFVFREPDPEQLIETLKRARDLYNRRNRWAWLIKRNMAVDNSWTSRVAPYEEVYAGATAERKAR